MHNFVVKSYRRDIFFSSNIRRKSNTKRCTRRKLKFLIVIEYFSFRNGEIFRSRCKIDPEPRTESRSRVYQRGFRLATSGRTAACHGDETS